MSETSPPDVDTTPGGSVPAVEGWFRAPGVTGPECDHAELLGSLCPGCGTYAFPPRSGPCPNPRCDATELDLVALSTTGTVWSYTENHYAPPPPFVATDPIEPYALAAVELAREGMVVLGKVARGVGADDLHLGMTMRVGVDVLFTDDDGTDHVVWVWEPAGDEAEGGSRG
jgi:uncharacterized OB-fold protein